MKFSDRNRRRSLLPAVLFCLAGCAEPAHIGMELLNFEVYQNGKKVYSFQEGIRDDAILSQKWNLLEDADLPINLAAADNNGEAVLSGDVEIRMLHAGSLISRAVLAGIRLVPGAQGGAWKVKPSEMARIKKAANVN